MQVNNTDFSLPVWKMTPREFERAVRDLESDAIRQQHAEANQRDLVRMGLTPGGQDETPAPKTGVETGTTSSKARAPAAPEASVGANALTMTDSEWAATLRSLK